MEPAASEFNELFGTVNGYEPYYSAVGSLDLAVPVLRTSSTGVDQLDAQLIHVQALDRGLILRLTYGEIVNPLAAALEVLEKYPDAVIVVDVEWSRDLISRQFWASAIIEGVFGKHESAEIILCGSSFPDSFADILLKKDFKIEERVLFDGVQRRFNLPIYYGDWGSTRPPKEGGGAGKRRIDLPQENQWIVYRESGEETYAQIAKRVTQSSEWPAGLNIWGTYAVSSTAESLPGAIRGQEAAAAARINIHLHRQAFYGDADIIGDTEEPFTDL